MHGLKDRTLAVSNRVGASRWFGQSGWRRRRLLILCYHGISLRDEHEWNPALYMAPQLLERRLEALHRNRCAVLPLGEAIERLYRNDLPERAVALTFDDGYFDFQERALPRLTAYGFPATVYLPTLRCEHNFPIVNVLVSYLLWMRRDRDLRAPDVPGLGEDRYPLRTREQRRLVLDRIAAAIDPVDPPPEERDAIARRIASHLGLEYDQFAAERLLTLLRPDEVASLSTRGISFELHTHRHRTPEHDAMFVEEIRENAMRIRQMTGVAPRHFCYPSGVYRMSYLPLLEAEGVVSATTTRPGIAADTNHPLLLPRFVDTSSVSDIEFEAWLQGVMPWLQGATGRAPQLHVQ